MNRLTQKLLIQSCHKVILLMEYWYTWVQTREHTDLLRQSQCWFVPYINPKFTVCSPRTTLVHTFLLNSISILNLLTFVLHSRYLYCKYQQLCLGLYATMQQAYTCLFGNEVNKVVNLDYQRIHISFISFIWFYFVFFYTWCCFLFAKIIRHCHQ